MLRLTRERAEIVRRMILTIVSSLVSLLVGAWLGAGADIFIRQPKLRISGGGGGGLPLSSCHLTVFNEPGFFGLSVGRTVLFGRHVWSGKRVGWPYDRFDAKCHAWIVPDGGGGGQSLTLWSPSGTNNDGSVTVRSGESANLYIFAKRREDDSGYFLFSPEAIDASAPPIPVISEQHRKFEDSMSFEIHVSHAGRDRPLRAQVSVVKTLQGNWQVKTPNGSMSF